MLQDKTSKIEKLQQLLHSERQRTELLIGAVLVCVFLLSFLKGLQDWLLPRIHGEVRKACLSEQSEGWPFPQHDWFEFQLLSTPRRLTTSRLACLLRTKSYGERELRERFLGGQWSTIHNASNIVYQRDRCESCGSGLFLQLSQLVRARVGGCYFQRSASCWS